MNPRVAQQQGQFTRGPAPLRARAAAVVPRAPGDLRAEKRAPARARATAPQASAGSARACSWRPASHVGGPASSNARRCMRLSWACGAALRCSRASTLRTRGRRCPLCHLQAAGLARLQVAALQVVGHVGQVHGPLLAPAGHVAHRDGGPPCLRRGALRARRRAVAGLAVQVVVVQVRQVPAGCRARRRLV